MAGRKKPANREGLRLRSGKWYGRYVDSNGKKVEKVLSTDRRVASTMLRELQRQAELIKVGLGDIVRQESPLDPWVVQYLAHLRKRWSASYCTSADEGLHDVLKRMGAIYPGDVTLDGILKVQDAMIEEKHSHRNINKKCGHLRAFLNWCVRTRRLPRNPLVGLPRLEESGAHIRRRRHRLTQKEAGKVLKAARVIDEERGKKRANRVPQVPFLELLLGTGFRLGEATSLRWRDLNHERGNWWLTVRAEHAKNGSARSNPISPELAATLKGLRGVQGRALGRLPSGEDRILLSPEGKPWTVDNLRNARRWLRAVLKKAGYKKGFGDGTTLDFHAFRHSFCCFLRESGVDVGTAAALMGHRTLAMTQQIYSSMDRLPKAEAIGALPRIEEVEIEEEGDQEAAVGTGWAQEG